MTLACNPVLYTSSDSDIGHESRQRRSTAKGAWIKFVVHSGPFTAPDSSISGTVAYLQTDVTSEVSAKNAIDTTTRTFGAIHGVINWYVIFEHHELLSFRLFSAGVATAMATLSKTGPANLSAFEQVLKINVTGKTRLHTDVICW